MDGFEENCRAVILLAATNLQECSIRPDPGPGRFESPDHR